MLIDVGNAWVHGCLLLVIIGLLNVSMRYIYSYMILLFGQVRDCKFVSSVGVLAIFELCPLFLSRVYCVISWGQFCFVYKVGYFV